jgi:hypothetical protein
MKNRFGASKGSQAMMTTKHALGAVYSPSSSEEVKNPIATREELLQIKGGRFERQLEVAYVLPTTC